MSVRIIATGGTFDKTYDPIAGRLDFSASHLDEILAAARLTTLAALEVEMLIDSLDMDERHRARVLAACQRSPQDRIVVVHGTDTMEQTARTLGAAISSKTIVLTGAMVPYCIAGSDALFNLGFAFAAAKLLAPGVYVAMNGEVHSWERVRQNRGTGVFEAPC